MRMSTKRQKKSSKRIKQTESQVLQALMEKKPYLLIESKDPKLNLNIPISSFTTIQGQANIDNESLPQMIDLSYTSESKATVSQSESQVVVDESNSKMINLSNNFLIIPTGSTDPKDSIPLSNIDYRFIAKLARRNWIEFMNYITLTITEEVTYENKTRTRTVIERDKRYEMLFRIIKIFTIANIGEEKIDISTLSLKKIMKMMGMEPTPMGAFITILIVEFKTIITNQTSHLKRNILYNRSALLMSVVQEVENSYVTQFERNATAIPFPKKNILEYDTNRKMANELLKDLNAKVKNQIEKINELAESDENTLVYFKDENGKDILLRRKLLKAILEEENEYFDRYLVEEYLTKEKLYIKKSTIDLSNCIELIELIDERNQKKIIVEKVELVEQYKTFTYYNKESAIINQVMNDKGEYRIRMIDINGSDVDKTGLETIQPQPEEERLIKEKKEELEKEINSEPLTSELVDLGNEKIVIKDLITKLKQNNDNLDFYTVNNTYLKDSPQIRITKEEIVKETVPLLEITNSKSQSKVLIEKNQFLSSISQWKKLSQRFDVNNNKGFAVKTDLYYSTINHYSSADIPIQISLFNRNLKNDLNPAFYYLEEKDINSKTIYIRKTYIDIITKTTKVYKKYYITDYMKNAVVISPSSMQKTKTYIEVLNLEDNQTYLIPCSDLNKALEDCVNDEFSATSSLGKVIQLKKTKLKIQNQSLVELGDQPEQYREDLISQIEDEYIEVNDTEDNSKHLIRTAKLRQVTSHKQTVPFETYIIEDNENKMVHVTKALCNSKLESKTEPNYICCKDSSNNKDYYLHSNQIHAIDCGFEDEIEYDQQASKNEKAKLKLNHIKIVKLNQLTNLPSQPEEEFMKEVLLKIEDANRNETGREYIQITDVSNKTILILKHYLTLIKIDQIGENKIEIIDCFSNKIIIDKTINLNQSDLSFFKIKNDKDNSISFTNREQFISNLKSIKRQKDILKLIDYYSNKECSLSPIAFTIINENISNLPLKIIPPKPVEIPVIVPVIVKEERNLLPQALDGEEPIKIQENIVIKEEDEEIISAPKPLKAVKPKVKQTYYLHRIVVKKIKKNK